MIKLKETSLSRLVVCFLFFSCLFGCAVSSHKIDPNVSTKYAIVYNVQVQDSTKDDWEVMRMDMDGSKQVNLTNNDDVAWSYYAYKNKLYFISDRDTTYRCFFLYETDMNGTAPKKVCDLRLEDSWMSSRNNGREMIVSARLSKSERYQLHLIDLSTGTYKPILADSNAYFSDPCFSPDGKQLVYSYKANKRDKASHEELYIVDLNDGKPRQLTTYPKDDTLKDNYGYKAGSARWHPTENFISYVSKQNGRTSIYAITPDGSKQWKLFDNPGAESWHDWSSDGNWLVTNASDLEERKYYLLILNWKTKEKTAVTDRDKSLLGPVFIEK